MLFKKNGVVKLSPKKLDEAADVLAVAFEHEPMINYVLTTNTLEHRRAFMVHMCEIRFEMDWPIFGYLHASRLVGVALASAPEAKEWPPSLVRSYMRLVDVIGMDAIKRLETYTQLSNRHRPKEPHVYFGVLGLLKEFQSKGYGMLIADAIRDFSQQHPTSTGIATETEKLSTVAFCERCGYHVTAQDKLGGNDVWIMFRPND